MGSTSRRMVAVSGQLLLPHNYRGVATLSKNNFNFHYVIGRGGFGKVGLRLISSCLIYCDWLGLEGRVQEEHASVRNERDVQGPNHC